MADRVTSEDPRYGRLLAAFQREGRPRTLTLGSVRWMRHEDSDGLVFLALVPRSMEEAYGATSLDPASGPVDVDLDAGADIPAEAEEPKPRRSRRKKS